MDEPLQLIQYLYGETSDEEAEAVEQRLAEDESLRREYEELRSVKDDLDDRPAQGPDALVVDQIVAAAGEAARIHGDTPEADRQPVARESVSRTKRGARAGTRSLTRRLQRASAALAVVLAVGVGWWQWAGPGLPGTETSMEATTASTPPAQEQTLSSGAAASRFDGSAADASALPDWDEGDDVVRLHRRIELLQARSTPTQWSSSTQWTGLQPARQTIRP